MKKFKFNKNSIVSTATILAVSLALTLVGPTALFAASPARINLGSAGNFVILAKTGISTTGATSIAGDIGISPAAATYMTGFGLTLPVGSGFSTSAIVNGKIYAPGYMNPTPANLTKAVLDMQNAYTEAMSRDVDVTELGAGNIGGLSLTPGVYKWSTNVTIPTNVTLEGTGDATDTNMWIFQIAQNLTVSPSAKIILTGAAQANNVFWIVGGQTTLGTTSVFNGNILDQTAVVLNTGATLHGRALAQTAVTLDSNSVIGSGNTMSNPIQAQNTSASNNTGSALGSYSSSISQNPAAAPNTNNTNSGADTGCAGGNSFSATTGKPCAGNSVVAMPAARVTYNFGLATLKNGSQGSAVVELQKFLNAKLNLGLTLDGKLGPKTIAVIKKWQKNNGLVADGLIGVKTKAIMNAQ